MFEINGCCKGPCEGTILPLQSSLPFGRTQSGPLQHVLIHIHRTMSGKPQVAANQTSCHLKQTLFSVKLNFVLCIVASLLLLLLLLHVAVFKNKFADRRMELDDHFLDRRIFVYSLYQYYSDSIFSGVCSQ